LRRALQGCEWKSRQPCYAYDIDHDVQPQAAGGPKTVPSIVFDRGPLKAENVPFCIEEAAAQLRSAVGRWPDSLSIAVHPWGFCNYDETSGGSLALALEKCRVQKAGSPGKCLLYAERGKVVFEPRRTSEADDCDLTWPADARVARGSHPIARRWIGTWTQLR